MVIYIVRHGHTEENQQRILQGHMPGHLTEDGKEQVRKTAEDLAERHVDFKGIVSSDLQRAIDSAEIIADRLHLPVIPNPILRERDWGIYTGMSISEATDKFRKDGKWCFPDPSVETEDGIRERACKVLRLLAEQYKDDTIIVVTHGQFARNMIAANLDCNYHEVAPFVNAEIRVLNVK